MGERQSKPANRRAAAESKAAGKEAGEKSIYARTTEEEFENRVDVTEMLLARRMRKSEIKRYLKSEFGVSARTCELYLSRARERILVAVTYERDQHRADSLAFYQSVVADSRASYTDRLRAQRQIDVLLGLQAPLKVAQTDTDGKDISTDAAVDRISALAERVFNRSRAGGAGASDSGVKPSGGGGAG